MKSDIKKAYQKLAKHDNYEIAKEAGIQLWFETGANSDESKKNARIKSMAKLAGMLALENQKDKKDIEQICEDTLLRFMQESK